MALLRQLCLAVCCAVAAGLGVSFERKNSLAFAGSVFPSLRPQALQTSFLGERSAIVSGLEQATEGILGLSMSCRRNLKKEKRARNEQMARQYRKPTEGFGRGGRGGRGGFSGGRAAAERQNEADSEWLSQIYGQHTIYRRDNAEAVAASGAGRKEAETQTREKVAA